MLKAGSSSSVLAGCDAGMDALPVEWPSAQHHRGIRVCALMAALIAWEADSAGAQLLTHDMGTAV